VPVYQRRRLLGVLVAGFPTRQMLEEETLARLCDRLQLDRQATEPLARAVCRRGMEEGDDYLRIVSRLIEHERAETVAEEETATISANLSSTYEELSLLYRISGSMKVTQSPRQFLQNVCNELMEVLNIAAAGVVATGSSGRTDVVVSGALALGEEAMKALVATKIAPRLGRDNRPVLENRLSPAPQEPFGDVRNFVAAPMVTEKSPIGVLIAFNKRSGDFDSVDMKLLSSIGSQAAVFLTNHRLYEDIQDLLMGVLHALTSSIDAKDKYTCGHSQRVALISRRLAEAWGFPPDKVQRVYLAGLLHDVGKIGVPESTLRKNGRLTEQEYQEIRRHPAIGAKILGGIRQLQDVLVGILCHHERPDGQGYPNALKGDAVPFEGLLVGLADSFDAMTSNRTYRQALPLDAVVVEIQRNKGTQFEPRLADKLLSMDLAAFLEEIRQATEPSAPQFAAGAAS
jgi:HD-GYP domain-containing protein (c-di-GMP phosphodiesterase class II)